MVNIKLRSGNGYIFTVDSEFMKCSSIIMNAMKSSAFSAGAENIIIPLDWIDCYTMSRLLTWAESDKDSDFEYDLDLSIEELNKLSNAAAYLQMDDLCVFCENMVNRLNEQAIERAS